MTPQELEQIRQRRELWPDWTDNEDLQDQQDFDALLAEVERLRNTEAWDEVERLSGLVERLQVEKAAMAEELLRRGSDPT